MTVADLIEKLSALDPTLPVLQSSDEEGNTFSSTQDFSIELVERNYTNERLEAGELFNKEELLEDGDYEEHEIDAAFKEVLVLWP